MTLHFPDVAVSISY